MNVHTKEELRRAMQNAGSEICWLCEIPRQEQVDQLKAYLAGIAEFMPNGMKELKAIYALLDLSAATIEQYYRDMEKAEPHK